MRKSIIVKKEGDQDIGFGTMGPGADAMKKLTPSLGIPYLGV